MQSMLVLRKNLNERCWVLSKRPQAWWILIVLACLLPALSHKQQSLVLQQNMLLKNVGSWSKDWHDNQSDLNYISGVMVCPPLDNVKLTNIQTNKHPNRRKLNSEYAAWKKMGPLQISMIWKSRACWTWQARLMLAQNIESSPECGWNNVICVVQIMHSAPDTGSFLIKI